MKKAYQRASAVCVFAFAEIKAAVEDFDRGDTNLSDALERIRDALSRTEEKTDDFRLGAA